MSLNLTAHQRDMLQHMGLAFEHWLPPRPAPSLAQRVTHHPAPAPAQAQAEVSATPPPLGAPRALEPAPEPIPEPVVRIDLTQTNWSQLQHAVRECRACGLCQSRQQTVFGVGAAPPEQGDQPRVEIMIVGEAPGDTEDQQGQPFVGAAGQLLDQMLAALGWSRKAQGGHNPSVFITNALKCRPPGDRNPQPDEVAQCRPFLQRQIELLQPRLLLALGRFGARALLADVLPHGHDTPLGKLRGQTYSHQGIPLLVTYHPAYLLRSPTEKGKVWADLCLARSLLAEPQAAT